MTLCFFAQASESQEQCRDARSLMLLPWVFLCHEGSDSHMVTSAFCHAGEGNLCQALCCHLTLVTELYPHSSLPPTPAKDQPHQNALRKPFAKHLLDPQPTSSLESTGPAFPHSSLPVSSLLLGYPTCHSSERCSLSSLLLGLQPPSHTPRPKHTLRQTHAKKTLRRRQGGKPYSLKSTRCSSYSKAFPELFPSPKHCAEDARMRRRLREYCGISIYSRALMFKEGK